MKKVLSIVAVALLSATASYAQEETRARILSIGPSIGFGHTMVSNVAGTNQFMPNWNAGLIVNYSKWEHAGFAGSALFSSEGTSERIAGRDMDLTIQYIRVPLKYAYFFGDADNSFRPKVTIGPSIGIMTDASVDLSGVTTNVTNDINMFDIGANASLGFNWKLGTNLWLNTDLDYYTGFMDVNVDAPKQYNSNIGVKVGLAFGL